MITDAELAALCTGIYDAKSVEWDHFDTGEDGDKVCWGLKKFTGGDVALVFRGSVTPLDWLRDVTALTNPFHHDDIGPVHPGFLSGMRTIERELSDLGLVDKNKDNLYLTGHSLGAGRAAILTGLLAVDGWHPVSRVVFGEPKPGFAQLADIIKGIPGRSYRNGNSMFHDPVTDVPFSFPPEQFVHPTAIIPVTCDPQPELFGLHGVFAWHHMPNYQEAITKLVGGGDHG